MQKDYHPSKGPQDILQIDLVGPLPQSNGFTHYLTAVDNFSRYKFAIPLERPDAPLVVKGLMSIFYRHTYVPNTILTDKGTTLTAAIVKQMMEPVGISIKQATIKHAQTTGNIKRNHHKLKTVPKVNISAHQRQWHQYVNIPVMAHKTTDHASLKFAPTKIFPGRTLHSALDLKYGNANDVTNPPTDMAKMQD